MKKIILLLAVCLMAACAHSPQQLVIKPVIDSAGERYGNGRAVVVSVEDARTSKEIGSRGGAYEKSSVITIKNDLSDAIARVVEAKLATQGFSINSGAADAATLKIIVDTLSYVIPKEGVAKKVQLEAVVLTELKAGNETYSSRYKTNFEKQTVVTPTMSANEAMINQLLSNTLARIFEDPKVQAFLSNI